MVQKLCFQQKKINTSLAMFYVFGYCANRVSSEIKCCVLPTLTLNPEHETKNWVFEATIPFSGYNIVIICLRWNNSCWCFTASSWKLQWIISTFLEFFKNGGRSTYFQWAVLLKSCSQSIQTCHIMIGWDTQVGFVFMNACPHIHFPCMEKSSSHILENVSFCVPHTWGWISL